MNIDKARHDMARLYIAAFNRTPDLTGLDYWTSLYMSGVSISSIASGFMGTLEGQIMYPSTLNNADFVDKIYQNVLGRSADLTGKLYWYTAIQNGLPRSSFINTLIEAAIANGSNDGLILENKADYGVLSAISGVSIIEASAKLSSITADSASVEEALVFNKIQAFTAGTDNINGANGDDIFNGDFTTVQSTDRINGGEGADALNLTGTTTLPLFSLIEQINFKNISGAIDLTTDTLSEVSSFTFESPTGNIIVYVTAQAVGLTNASSKTLDAFFAKTAKTIVFTTINTQNSIFDIVSAEGATDIKIAAIGSNNIVLKNSSFSSLAKLTINGSGSLIVDLSDVSLSKLKTIDASQNTGGVDITLLSLTNIAHDIKGSSLNDIFNFSQTLSKDDKLDGGGGYADTLKVSISAISDTDANMKNIEKIVLSQSTDINLSGQTESFLLTGSSADDIIKLGTGLDTINAGAGDDIIYTGVQSSPDIIDGGSGTDKIILSGNLTLLEDTNINLVEEIVFSNGEVLDVSKQSEGFIFMGSAQNDTIKLNIGGGSDIIDFGSDSTAIGVDTIYNFNPLVDKIKISALIGVTDIADMEFVDGAITNIDLTVDSDGNGISATSGAVYKQTSTSAATQNASDKAVIVMTEDIDGIGDNTVNNRYEIYYSEGATLTLIGILVNSTELDIASFTQDTFI